jgi:hypothetical protein
MRQGSRAGIGPLLGAALLLGIPAQQGQSYEWITDHPIRGRSADIVWDFNASDCPEGALDMLLAASALLDFYTLTPFALEFRGHSERPPGVDGDNVVSCRRVLDYMAMGYSFQSAGVTKVSKAWGVISDADIIFNADRLSFDIALHELTHLMGLAHSEASDSIVCYSEVPGHCRPASRLAADDLVGLAHLYDVPANCTPYLDDELVLYFPYIDGHWAELRPEDDGAGGTQWKISDHGPSLEYHWQCELDYSSGFTQVRTEVYHDGKVAAVELHKEGGHWRMREEA